VSTGLQKRFAGQTQREGIGLVVAMAGLMWIVEIINSLDSNGISNGNDGIIARSFSHLWGIFTSPFIHASFQHLISNTIPFLFMGLIIALRGAARVGLVTLIVIVIGGLGTWLIAPSNTDTIGASGIVFGYAAYLLARGLFDRSLLEVATGVIVGAVWGTALLSSLVPHTGVSWQAHVCGGIAGVIAAWLLADARRPKGAATPGPPATRTSVRI
jgi:membrane associated rhomboid family serine protease